MISVIRRPGAAVDMATETMPDGEPGEDFKGVAPMFEHVHGARANRMADAPIRSVDGCSGQVRDSRDRRRESIHP